MVLHIRRRSVVNYLGRLNDSLLYYDLPLSRMCTPRKIAV